MTQRNIPQGLATGEQKRPPEPPAWLMRHQVPDDINHPEDLNGIPPEGFISYYGRRTLGFVIEAARHITWFVFRLLFWMVLGLISLVWR